MASAQTTNQILAAIRDWRHWVGNAMLDQLVVPPVEGPMDRDARFTRRMLSASAEAERTMLEFFELGELDCQEKTWRTARLRLFISHVSDAKAELAPLTTELERYGIHSFLAHEAIEPAKNWREVLLDSLDTMDALLSFHSKGFRDSEWCAQEVGFAFGLGVPVIPVLHGELPCGFESAVQGIKWKADSAKEVAAKIVTILQDDEDTAIALGDALARELKFAGSFDYSDFCVAALGKCGELSDKARRSIELALLLNDQVRGRHGAMALIGQEEPVPA
jgi:hypothetical protein